MANRINVLINQYSDAGGQQQYSKIGQLRQTQKCHWDGQSKKFLNKRFCKEYNARTQSLIGQVIPVEITIFSDNSFNFVMKTSPAVDLIKKAASITSGSAEPNKTKVGKINRQQVREIAEIKLKDLGPINLESAMLMVEGTARSMGITVID